MNVVEGLRIDKRGSAESACKHAIARRSSGSLNAHLVIHSWIVGSPESAGINRHVVGDERALQERRQRIHPGLESCR